MADRSSAIKEIHIVALRPPLASLKVRGHLLPNHIERMDERYNFVFLVRTGSLSLSERIDDRYNFAFLIWNRHDESWPRTRLFPLVNDSVTIA